jgi:hypothetical protein
MMATDRIGELMETAKAIPAEARTAYTEAVVLARGSGDDRLAYVLRHLSDLVRAKNPTDALSYAEEARGLYIAKAESSPLDRANAARLIALANTALDRESGAITAWREASRLYAEAGVEVGKAESEARLRALNARQE